MTSPYAVIVPLNLHAMKSKVIVGSLMTALVILWLLFGATMGIASITQNSDPDEEECHDSVIAYWVSSWFLQAIMLLLIGLFVAHIYRKTPFLQIG